MGDSGVPEADTASDVASVTSGGRPAEPVESTDSRLGRLMAALSTNTKNAESEQALNIQNGKGKDGCYRYSREFLLYLRESPLSKAGIRLELFVKDGNGVVKFAEPQAEAPRPPYRERSLPQGVGRGGRGAGAGAGPGRDRWSRDGGVGKPMGGDKEGEPMGRELKPFFDENGPEGALLAEETKGRPWNDQRPAPRAGEWSRGTGDGMPDKAGVRRGYQQGPGMDGDEPEWMTYEEPTEQMTFQAMPNKDTPDNARGHFSGAGGNVGKKGAEGEEGPARVSVDDLFKNQLSAAQGGEAAPDGDMLSRFSKFFSDDSPAPGSAAAGVQADDTDSSRFRRLFSSERDEPAPSNASAAPAPAPPTQTPAPPNPSQGPPPSKEDVAAFSSLVANLGAKPPASQMQPQPPPSPLPQQAPPVERPSPSMASPPGPGPRQGMQGQGTPRVAGLPPPGMAPYYGAPYGYPPRGPMPMQPPPMGYPPELHPHFMPRGPFPPGMPPPPPGYMDGRPGGPGPYGPIPPQYLQQQQHHEYYQAHVQHMQQAQPQGGAAGMKPPAKPAAAFNGFTPTSVMKQQASKAKRLGSGSPAPTAESPVNGMPPGYGMPPGPYDQGGVGYAGPYPPAMMYGQGPPPPPPGMMHPSQQSMLTRLFAGEGGHHGNPNVPPEGAISMEQLERMQRG